MKKTAFVIVCVAACVAFVGTVPAGARKKQVAASGSVAAPQRLDERTLDGYRIPPAEAAAIRDYYSAHPEPATEPAPARKKKKLPPGLRKKVERGGELPPGWQKKVARGEVMDPVVYERARPLPPVLVKTLPPPPPGTVIVTVEGKVVRLLEATRTILDVFDLH